MSHLFTILPFSVPNSTLPVVPFSDIRRLTPIGAKEPQAYDIWEFGGDALSLTGTQIGKQLSLQGDAPVYSDNYLSMSTNAGKALLSDFTESALLNDTIWAVVRIPTVSGSKLPILFGTMGTTINNTGSSVFVDGSNRYSHNARGLSGIIQNTSFLNNGGWTFVCYSRRVHSSGAYFAVLTGGHSVFENSATGTYRPSANPVAIGGAYYDNNGVSIDVAEFGIIPRALPVYEMQALYRRSKARMAGRGIVVT